MPPSLDIHLYVHGRGRGHASRALHLVTELAARGHRARAFAGRDAVAVLGDIVSTIAIDTLPPTVGVDAIATAWRRVPADVARMSASRPDVVVSDGDLPSLCAARLCGIPGVAVGHGLVFMACVRPSGVPRVPWWREAMKARVASLGAQRRIAVHFARLPLHDRAAVLAASPSVAPPAAGERRGLVAYFRDGLDARLLAAIREVAPTARVFAPRGPEGVTPPDRDAFAEAFARARAVLATAGSQLIGECVASGTPLLAVYRRDDDEQRLNAALLARAGLGCAAPIADVDAPMLRAFLDWAPLPGATIARPEVDASRAVIDACERLAGGAR